MLFIVDYGMGNLRSVQKAFAALGVLAQLTTDPTEVERASAIVVPGVGAFGQAMENLNKAGLAAAIRQQAERGTPLLGICLGLQILFEGGEEAPGVAGLGILPGTAPRLPELGAEEGPPLKVPHVGWNQVRLVNRDPLLAGIPDGSFFYFVHSYYVQPTDTTVVKAVCQYGLTFPAVLHLDNVVATQFHPEKSGAVGLTLLKNFVEVFKLNR